MDLTEFDFNLIPHVAAQETDGDVQPTFGNIADITLPGTTASVLITADSTNVQIGTTVSVNVEVKTGDFTISEYRIVVDFDPSKLAVVDADPATPGTQIEMLDLVFAVDQNTTSAAGRVTLIAKTTSGQALQVNRKVARITFQAQSLGATNVKVVTGSTGSQLINENGVAIASSTNSVTLNLTSEAVSTTTSSATQSTSTTSPATSGTTSATTAAPDVIPDTALPEDLIAIISVLAGLSLATLGIILRRSRPHPDA